MKKVILAVMSCTFLLSAVASAELRATSYPGLLCRYYGKLANDSVFNPASFGANGLKNTSDTYSYYAACPIANPTYDSELSESGNSYLVWGRISLDTSSDVCKIYTRSLTGSYTAWYNTTSIETQSDGLYRHVNDPSGLPPTYGDSVTILCYVPPEKYINNYDAEFYWF